MPDPGELQPAARAATAVPADPRTGYLLNRYQQAHVIMVAPLAGVVTLVTVLAAAHLRIWDAVAVSVTAVTAVLTCLRARRWTQTISRHLQHPPAPEIWLGRVCARPAPLNPAQAGQRYLDLLALTPSMDATTRVLVRVPLIAGQRLPAGWQQGDPVTVFGSPRPGRVIVAVAAGTVLLPAGRARWPLRHYAPINAGAPGRAGTRKAS